VFNKKSLNWVGIPDDEKVNKFTAQPFDLLLACFIEPNASLEFVAYVSKAKYRVGVLPDR